MKKTLASLTVLATVLTAAPALAQSAPLIERVKFFGNPTRAAARVSPMASGCRGPPRATG